MIKSIDEFLCIKCGLCESICQTDILRSQNGSISIAYPDDCCNCMECVFVCPTDAIQLTVDVPKKFDVRSRWLQIKKALNVK
jgi:NAD-dependent dihydropyrimidine dehydrogenase PreA subunit